METVDRMLHIFGGIFVISGLLLVVLGRIPVMGQLPGDVHIEWRNISCYLPLASGILLGVLATIVLNLIIWLLRK
jgi:hypothetical protein